MKSSTPSIVASTIHGDVARRRRSFVSAVQSLAADVRGHVQGRAQTQKEDALPPPPKIGQQIPSKAASILGRTLYSASRSVDNFSTTSMGARPRPSNSASSTSLGLTPTSRPLMTLRLSSTSFLDTTIADDLQCQQLYSIQTRSAHTIISREDAVQGSSRVGSIYWRSAREDERSPPYPKCDITVQMAGGRRVALNDFLRSNKLLGSRKFNIPHYPYTLKWKRYGRTYSLSLSKMKKIVATLEPAVLSAPPRIRVYEPVYERDESRPQIEHQGVPIPLLDYLVVTSLLLLTDKDEWQQFGGAPDSSSNNASGSNLPSFRSDSGSGSGDANNAVHSIHHWRSGVETEPFSSRPSSPALSSAEDDIISLRTDESISALPPGAAGGRGRSPSTADETASIPSFRSFYTDASVPSTIRPTSSRPPPQQRLPEPARPSTDSNTSVVSILHPFASGNLNDEDEERVDDDVLTYAGKDAALGFPTFLQEMHSGSTRIATQNTRDTDTRTIRSPLRTASHGSSPTVPPSQARHSPARPASAGGVSSDRQPLRPRPLPRPPVAPPRMDIPPVPKLSPEIRSLFSQSQGGPSTRRIASSPLSSSFSDDRDDALSGAGAGPSTAAMRTVRPTRSQTLRRIASDTTISPVRTSPSYIFDHSYHLDSSEVGPLPNKRLHDSYSPYEDSAFSFTPSSSHHNDNYQSQYQGSLSLSVQSSRDNTRITDNTASASSETESVYHSLHSPPLYPHSPPENSFLCSQPPPAYDSIDFSYP